MTSTAHAHGDRWPRGTERGHRDGPDPRPLASPDGRSPGTARDSTAGPAGAFGRRGSRATQRPSAATQIVRSPGEPDPSSRPPARPLDRGIAAWIDCALDREVELGDHVLVVGRVLDLGIVGIYEHPMVFSRAAYPVLGS